MSSRNTLATVGQVEAVVGRPNPLVNLKQVDRLDDGCVAVLAHSPIAGFGYLDAAGDRRATFVGGTPGFVRVHSPRRISFELTEAEPITGGVSFVFLLPGIGETLRLNGVVTDQERSRLQVDVREAYVHCARCIIRSQLWERRTTRLNRVDVRNALEAMPFFVVTSGDANGGSDTSPRGDQPGFVRMLDDKTIAIPDRKGNQRADTLHNLLQDDRIALAALLPGRSEILRLHGTATITDDPDLLRTMALRGMAPHAALIIRIADAEVATDPAVADLWSARVDPGAVPDLNVLAARHAAANAAGPTGVLLRGLARVARPFSRLMGAMLRSQVRKEGYAPGRPGDARSSREMTIADVRRETPHAVTLVLEDPERPIDFRPGQFFTLITEIDGRPVRRAYSACSAPGTGRLEVTVKRVDGGVFSTHADRVLRRGDRITVRGPSGHLPAPTGDLFMVAAGSGVTPMISIIRAVLAGPGTSRLALLYGNRDETSILFAADLDRLRRDHPERLTVTHQLTRPGPQWSGDRGRLDAGSVRKWLDRAGPSPAATYLLCGPDPVMATAADVLTERGIPAGRVHRESYTSAVTTPAGTGPHPMTVEDDGHLVATVTVEPGQTLLSAGLAAGAPMPYSCTVGNCGECVVRLRTGEVAMSEPHCLTVEQRAAGYVLTCVGQPLSAVAVDLADPA
ncbi:2Fe-2S iron-sulfur cluster-binding protein [Actinoplanes sp. HUAS TT8]|uniref:2Fe-2S iron-sulfur cluster-binding protein n=1 Tax=Actinoplanes sp. HUAS TT8 TaxID=3447453 RepID=UPI003F524509